MANNVTYTKLFADLVKAGRWTIDQVPAGYKEDVKKVLETNAE